MTYKECSEMILEVEDEMRRTCLDACYDIFQKQEKLTNLMSVRDQLRKTLITLLKRENQDLYIKLKKVS